MCAQKRRKDYARLTLLGATKRRAIGHRSAFVAELEIWEGQLAVWGRLPRFVIACAALLLCAQSQAGLPPGLAIGQLKHTRFTTEDGAPPAIKQMAQGRDGFLWIASSEGLFRFDGIQFERIPRHGPARDNAASAVMVAADGTVWVGYVAGGVDRYRNGRLESTTTTQPDTFVMRFAQTSDGAIWAMLGSPSHQLVRYADGVWKEQSAALGLPPAQPFDLLAARDGRLLISLKSGIFVLRPRSKRFERSAIALDGSAALLEDAAGQVWVIDRKARLLSQVSKQKFPYQIPAAAGMVKAVFDRSSNIWARNNRDGLIRIMRPNSDGATSQEQAVQAIEQFDEAETLTSNSVTHLFQDREGNVWVATSRGLDRFRPPSVVVEPSLSETPKWGNVLLAARDGDVFAGVAAGVYRIKPFGHPVLAVSGFGEAEALCEGQDNTVWMVLEHRIIHYRDRIIEALDKPESRQGIIDCAVDGQGRLALTALEGIFWRQSGRWDLTPIEREDATDGNMPIARLSNGSLLTYTSAQTLRLYADRRVSEITLKPTGAIAHLRTIHPLGDSFLLGGGFGIARLRGSTLRVISSERVPAFSTITGIAETADGNTWTIGRAGIARIRTALLQAAFDGEDVNVSPQVYDYRDGLKGFSARDGKRDAVRGGDGRIWFATSAGTVWLDPSRLPHNRLPPPVVLTKIQVGNLTVRDPRGKLSLKPGTGRIEISFTAPSLTIPERVRFRYRLEGQDADWIDPGSLRRAFYTNLAPGTYVFRVIAANNDGVWNRTGASLEFTIPPTFLQSEGFRALCFLGVGLLLWFAYRLRTRQLTARVRERLEAQIAERERIARELHDTLLQGFQGLLLRFQSVANRMRADDSLRPPLDAALEKAETVLIEGRRRVSELRFKGETPDLPEALAEVGRAASQGESPSITLTVEGEPRDLDDMVREEVLRIGEEAVGNAVRHAEAQAITINLVYGSRDVRLSINDDGVGLPDAVAATGEKTGHYGLVGMRERAERAGGRLIIASRKGGGTEIRVTVPARVAYLDRLSRAPVQPARSA